MKIEIGKSYRVIENRESFYGGCSDIVELEGKVVTVVSNAASKGYNIKDKLGNGHVCEEYNLEEIKQETEGLKVGDIVTGSQKYQWLDGGYAKVVKTKGESATIEIIKRSESKQCPAVGETDDGWELKWLVKVVDYKPSEQLKDNIKEDGIMVKGFKAGDKIKIINWDSISCVEVGDTAEIIGIRSKVGQNIKIRMDKDGKEWVARESEIEIVTNSNSQQLEIITSGTTTTVKLEDGREGTVKLYYKDEYSKGFGIVAALGKAMDIDLVGEVQKVIESYELRGTKPKLTIVDEVAFAHTFKVGDIVRGTEAGNKRYGITNKRVLEAEVTNVRSDGSKIDILIKKYEGGRNYDSPNFSNLESEFFELVEAPSVKFEVGCKVKIPKTKSKGDCEISKSYNIIKAKEIGQEYLFVTGIEDNEYILNVEDNRCSRGDYFGLEDLELYTETPSLKKPILKEEVKEKVNVNFKKGDKVRITKEIGGTSGKTSAGDTAIIGYVGAFDYSITMNKDGRSWYANDKELEAAITNFKVGDSVKVREDLALGKEYLNGIKFVEGMQQYKGKSFVIENRSYPDKLGFIFKDICWCWAADMLEKVEEKAEDEVIVTTKEVEFKKGDRVYRELKGYDTLVGTFTKIEGDSVWANWNSGSIKELPKTILEFNKVELNTNSSYVITKDAVKKLVLVDDTISEIKVGDEVKKEQAIKILKTGGKIKSCSFTYFEECGILKYKREDGTIGISAGYDVNLGGKLEVISLSKDIDKYQAEKMVKEGKEVTVNNIFKYFLEDGVLMFRSNKTDMLHESLGFKEAFKEGFTYSVS